MSATELDQLGDEHEKGTIKRVFDAELSPGDGRTIDVRIVPYGLEADVKDPGSPVYREMWLPGAFSDQVRGAQAGRAKEVFVNFEHGQSLGDVLGRGTMLREADDGFYGSFQMLETPDADKALMLARDGALSGISMEAYPKKSVRKNGVVQRVKAHLVNIALCRRPAYAGASVLAFREESLMMDESVLPVELDEAIIERCRRLGIALPERLAGVMMRAYSEASWDGSASRWPTTAAYCAACAIDLNAVGKPKTKSACYLPYKEPSSGDINLNGVRAALTRIGQGFPKDASQAQRDEARAMFERILAAANKANSTAQRAAPSASDGDEQAANRLDAMIAMANNFIADEDDPQDKATMQTIVASLQRLRNAETSEAA